jgi:ATP-dependent Clp protease ATP-binding subunit ClpC
MPNQMHKFTARARRVMSYAQEEATNLRHAKIEPEHFLLAMLRESTSIGGRTLIELGLGYNQLQQLVGNLSIPAGDTPIDLSDSTKHLLEDAVAEAKQMGHDYIGTEHMLLGMVRRDNRARELLADLGVSSDEVRKYVRRVLQEKPDTSSPASEGVLLLWMQQHGEAVNSVLREMGVDAVLAAAGSANREIGWYPAKVCIQ